MIYVILQVKIDLSFQEMIMEQILGLRLVDMSEEDLNRWHDNYVEEAKDWLSQARSARGRPEVVLFVQYIDMSLRAIGAQPEFIGTHYEELRDLEFSAPKNIKCTIH